MAREQIRLEGQWLAGIGAWGELSYSQAADGGCKDASWKMPLPRTYSHPSLVSGKLVEIRVGPSNVWMGLTDEPDPSGEDGWQITAQGLSAEAQSFLCFDSSFNTTSTPDVAIDTAISEGLHWSRPTSISSTPLGSAGNTTADLNYLGPMLDALGDSSGMRWGVDADGQVYLRADPTVPTWHLVPGVGRFGLAPDEFASNLFGRFINPGVGYDTEEVEDSDARSRLGTRQYASDLTALGPIAPAAAIAALNGLIAKGKSRQGYTNGLTVSKYQLTTPGGTPAPLHLVRGQQMVRQYGVVDEHGTGRPYLEWVIGETRLEAGAESIDLTPVGLVARNMTDVLSLTGSQS